MDVLWLAGTAGIFGLAVGSFVNVILTRVPRGLSIAYPPSHCTDCRRYLTPWELVPVLSFIAGRGRCRTCEAAIGWQHPLVELLAALLAAGSALIGGAIVAAAALLLMMVGAYLWAVSARIARLSRYRQQDGGLLVETAVASTLLLLTIAALLDPLIAGYRGLQDATRRVTAGYLATRKLEELRSQSYCDLNTSSGTEQPFASIPDYQVVWDLRPHPDPAKPDRLWISVRASRSALTRGRNHELVFATVRGRDQSCEI